MIPESSPISGSTWPPDDHYPIEEWTDDELIDQYRHVKAEFASDTDYMDSDEHVGALLQEIIRRGLDDLAEAVEDVPTTSDRGTSRRVP